MRANITEAPQRYRSWGRRRYEWYWEDAFYNSLFFLVLWNFLFLTHSCRYNSVPHIRWTEISYNAFLNGNWLIQLQRILEWKVAHTTTTHSWMEIGWYNSNPLLNGNWLIQLQRILEWKLADTTPTYCWTEIERYNSNAFLNENWMIKLKRILERILAVTTEMLPTLFLIKAFLIKTGNDKLSLLTNSGPSTCPAWAIGRARLVKRARGSPNSG